MFRDVLLVMLNEERDPGFILVVLVVYKDQKRDVVVQNGVPVGEVQTTVHKHTTHAALTADEIQTQVHVSGLFHSGIGPRVTGRRGRRREDAVGVQRIQTED